MNLETSQVQQAIDKQEDRLHAAGLAKQAKRRASVVLQKVIEKMLERQAAMQGASSEKVSVAAVGYVQRWDDKYNVPYYVHEETEESFWEIPHNRSEQ